MFSSSLARWNHVAQRLPYLRFMPCYRAACVDRNGRQIIDDNGKPKTEFEQTTFFEWVDSRFVVPPICRMATLARIAICRPNTAARVWNSKSPISRTIPFRGPGNRTLDAPARQDLADSMSQRIHLWASPVERHQFVRARDVRSVSQGSRPLQSRSQSAWLPSGTRYHAQKTAVGEGMLLAQTSTAKIE